MDRHTTHDKLTVTPSLKRRRKLTPLKLLSALILSPLLVLIALYGWSEWRGNFHTVLPGELYRSGQLSAQQLQQHIERYDLRSVINLRGPDPGDTWYETERTIARQHGVEHVDFELWSSKSLTDQQLDELVVLLRKLPKPLLIHCLGGADRTGLATALYLYDVKGESASTAIDQLSIRFGHFPYLFRSEVAAMDESFQRYVSRSLQSDNP